MEELQKFRYTPDDGMAPPGRKRPSDTQGESKESVEVSMVEPPSVSVSLSMPTLLNHETVLNGSALKSLGLFDDPPGNKKRPLAMMPMNCRSSFLFCSI